MFFSEYVHELYQILSLVLPLIFLDLHQGWMTHDRFAFEDTCSFRCVLIFSLKSFRQSKEIKLFLYFFPVDFFSTSHVFSLRFQCYQIKNFLNQQKTLINNQICHILLSLNDSTQSSWPSWKISFKTLTNQINAFHFFVKLLVALTAVDFELWSRKQNSKDITPRFFKLAFQQIYLSKCCSELTIWHIF